MNKFPVFTGGKKDSADFLNNSLCWSLIERFYLLNGSYDIQSTSNS